LIHVVTGALGYSGRSIARRLLRDGHRVRTLTGSPNRPDPFGGRVEIHPLSFDEPYRLAESLRAAAVLVVDVAETLVRHDVVRRYLEHPLELGLGVRQTLGSHQRTTQCHASRSVVGVLLEALLADLYRLFIELALAVLLG